MKRLGLALMALVLVSVGAIAQTAQPLRPYALRLDIGTKTATATAGAATLNKSSGVVTSEALTTAAAATYTLTLTNSNIAVGDQVYASVGNGTNTAGLPEIATITPGAGTVTIVIRNAHASAALNGTLTISFMILKA